MQYPRVKLGDVCDFYRGLTYSKSDEVEKSSNVVLRSNNINLENNVLDFTELKYINDEITIPCEKLVKKNTLLMCMANGSKQHLGKVALIDSEYGYAFGGFMGLLIPKNIYPKYLYYSLIAPQFTFLIQHLTDGTNINNLKFSDIKEYEFSLPALPDQQEIVARLEKELAKVDEMAESFKRMAELADEEFKSVLSETFEHVEGKKVKLGDIADVYDGDHQPPPQVEEGIPFLVISNVADGRLNFENTRKVPRQYYDSLSLNRKPQLNDLLLTVTGSYGIPVKVDVKREFCFQRHIALIRTTKLQLDFLFYFMKSKKSQQYFDKVATGTAQKTVSLSALRNMPIIYPKDEIQLSISKYADSTYKNYLIKKDYIYKGISLCSELRKSILQEAFS